MFLSTHSWLVFAADYGFFILLIHKINMAKKYDLIVIGSGPAGTDNPQPATRLKTLLNLPLIERESDPSRYTPIF